MRLIKTSIYLAGAALVLSSTAIAQEQSTNSPPTLLQNPSLIQKNMTKLPEVKTTPKGKHIINEIVAVVNDEPITLSELNAEVVKTKAQLQEQPNAQLPDTLTLQRQVLQQLINQTIALQMAKRQGISVSDDEVNASIAQILAQNGMSLDALKTRLKHSNLSFEDYFNTVKHQMIINKLQQRAIAGKVYIPPQDIQKYIKTHFSDNSVTYTVQNILLALPQNATDAQKNTELKKANDIINDIKAKKISFSAAAQKYSQSTNASSGGSLGSRKLSELPQIYADAVATLQAGEIAPPFIANGGIQIIKLDDKQVPESAKHYVDQYKVSQIVIDTSPIVDNEQAKAKLSRIITAIDNGQSFADAAKANSQNHDNASDGGNMGWIDPNTLSPVLASKIKTTKIGKISTPFQVGNQWQIIQVNDKRKEDNTKAYQTEQATNALFQQNAQQALKTWMLSLRDSAYVKILDDKLKLPEQ
ncbi:peptidylprolyl isomerase [Fangia hongkongensis]|uniref:peptidylprolyl isomerase n=1 Tax=Fangia hongkongensis TaxID=270495 RepID=UPI000379DC21|nr:peptidylprolyl isomerase [Fangia hongkongensis]MBK2124144.1 peptidylprolyl isomerase [Fangia hongkongensis]